MQIEIRADKAILEGYVNTVERKSKPLRSRIGQFVEKITKGTFKRALEKNDDVKLLLNHDWSKEYGSTKQGNLELVEDNIGLRVRAEVTDADLINKARQGKLVGWSFGFKDSPNGVVQSIEDGVITRNVKDIELLEVSILDNTKKPAYDGTLVTVRSDEDIQYHGEPLFTDIEVREAVEEEPKQHENVEKETIDYSPYEAMIKEMKEEL